MWRVFTFLSKHKLTFGINSEDFVITVERRQADSRVPVTNHSGGVQRKRTTVEDGALHGHFLVGPQGSLAEDHAESRGVSIPEFSTNVPLHMVMVRQLR